jgi:hypothetical protein
LYSRAEVIFKDEDDHLSEAGCLMNRAIVLSDLGSEQNLKQAIDLYSRAEVIFKKYRV